ncbi:hypothetical protein FQN49_006561, partial [Arthroderma sp. PD_2]
PAPAPAPKANIKILPRPASNNNEAPPTATKVDTSSPTPPKPNVRLSELTKPFKPKILRRPDKDNLEAYLPTSTVTVDAFSKPERRGAAGEEPAKQTQPQFDQRSSQSATQKETLLSLFNKDTTSLSTVTEQEPKGQVKSPIQVSPPFSTLISPATDPLNSPREATRGVGSDKHSGVTSPTNQAFLLGYLEGVALGKK